MSLINEREAWDTRYEDRKWDQKPKSKQITKGHFVLIRSLSPSWYRLENLWCYFSKEVAWPHIFYYYYYFQKIALVSMWQMVLDREWMMDGSETNVKIVVWNQSYFICTKNKAVQIGRFWAPLYGTIGNILTMRLR